MSICIQDVLNKKEDLLPELVAHLQEGELGPTIHHPLLIQLFVVPDMYAFYNAQFTFIKNQLEQYRGQKQWVKYICRHEKPYRLSAFVEVMDDLTDKEYWETLAYIWITCENLWQYKETLPSLLQSPRRGKEYMMEEEEQKRFAELPQKVLVYRGCTRRNMRLPSWTLNLEKAKWFAKRFGKKNGLVLEAYTSKKNIVALFLGRGEEEVVLARHPRNIKKIAMP